jgi:ubiquinone/menaquinone biosynthesis C-methylase UbiE
MAASIVACQPPAGRGARLLYDLIPGRLVFLRSPTAERIILALREACLGLRLHSLPARLWTRLRLSAHNCLFLSVADLRQRLDRLDQDVDGSIAEPPVTSEGFPALRIEHSATRSGTAARLETISNTLDSTVTRISGLGSALRGDYYKRKNPPTSTEYWARHNVTVHHRFTSIADSLNHLQFRNQQYPGYIDLLPVSGKDGMAVLDYGCGPGHDLVGFGHFSRPKRLVGVDISPSSLVEADARLQLHGTQAELVRIDHGTYDLPFEAASFDYIHCSGVLMCIAEPARLLREFHRLLRPGGELRLMVYNYDSIWLHLYVAYVVQIENGLYSDLPPRIAFTRTTDGEDCPVNAVWRPEEMLALGREAGFEPEFLGAAISLWELHTMPKRHIACLHAALPAESRFFLMNLRLDSQGHPFHGDHRAGIDGCFRFRRPQ